ncbi:MAG: phytanoyl-CoA dioxygenase family protein [Acidimicrobiia bacterium]|nr:phytanoyl-CoA dioxygenase family protein [Acidimicrobiia bacterium]
MATDVRRGWFASVPPNGFQNRPDRVESNNNVLGLDTPEPDIEIETSPEHRNLTAGDPHCADWERRADHPGVLALREELRAHNGIPDLEIISPHEVDRAVELFHRDGFVVVRDALTGDRYTALQDAADAVVDEILAGDPDASIGGGAGGLPHRYSFGMTSASRHRLHHREWVDLIDLPTTTPILTAIFGSANYVVGGGGGDLALPGAIEYQGLHSDNVWAEPFDPVGGITTRDMPVPVVTINFPTTDLTWENGPIRQIPGTQRSTAPIPSLADEPASMRHSTLCPVPGGAAIIRDNRAWHGGTPNLSSDVRAMPNIEYWAPWFRSEGINRCMPHDLWVSLSEHAQRISRYVVCDPGEPVVGAGFTHPRAKDREAFIAQQLQSMGPDAELHWRTRR